MLKAYCEACDVTEAFKSREEMGNWHGNHRLETEQIDRVEFASIKRKKGGPHNPKGNNHQPSVEPRRKNCPFCMNEMPRGMARHLPNCEEAP